MTRDEKALLLGFVLGDGHLRQVTKFTADLRFYHSIEQLEYLEFKVALLAKALGCEPPKIYHRPRKDGHVRIEANKCTRFFGILRRALYRNGVKTLTLSILKRLTDEAVAIWWMDDASVRIRLNPKTGVQKSREAWLWTYCTEADAIACQRFFEHKYGIMPKLAPRRKKSDPNVWFYSLRFNTKDMSILIPRIRPYACKSMLYKFFDVVHSAEPLAETKGEDIVQSVEKPTVIRRPKKSNDCMDL